MRTTLHRQATAISNGIALRPVFSPIAAVVAAALLCACGGGGSGSPAAPKTVPQPAGSPAPSAANRTAVGTAQLTLQLPASITAAATAAARTGAAGSTARRGATYVNPTSGSWLDIYVDGTLAPNLDGSAGSNDSLLVTNTSGDATQQNISLPLYSTTSNQIVAVEWNSAKTSLLAIGEVDHGPFPTGSTLPLTLTMQMNAKSIGLVSFPSLSSPAQMSGNYGAFPCPSPALSNGFALFGADGSGTFVPVVGYSGTATPALTSVTPDAGTTRIAQSTAGSYLVSWDASCDGVTASASVPNPAYAIYNDVTSNAGGYSNGNYKGPNYGIWQLWNNAQLIISNFANPTAIGSVHIIPHVPTTVPFSYLGVTQSFVVPSAVSQVTVVANGAQGSGNGGGGGSVTATIPVTPLETLYVYVGGQGTLFNGGGASGGDGCNSPGGDASDVREGGAGLGNRVVVAGGGGGGGCDDGYGGGAGGQGGSTGSNGGSIPSGGGGGLGATLAAGGGGGGGGAGVGGPAGITGATGTLGLGGTGGGSGAYGGVQGDCSGLGGSGGGGGYYGGGGAGGGGSGAGLPCGGNGYGGGGGGGGSSYTEPSATSVTNLLGTWFGNGTVSITY